MAAWNPKDFLVHFWYTKLVFTSTSRRPLYSRKLLTRKFSDKRIINLKNRENNAWKVFEANEIASHYNTSSDLRKELLIFACTETIPKEKISSKLKRNPKSFYDNVNDKWITDGFPYSMTAWLIKTKVSKDTEIFSMFLADFW